MKKISDIVKEYADEFFTSEFLLSGVDTWDLAALTWFDEKYPELSDEQRSEFSVQLDDLFRACRARAWEQHVAEYEKNKNAPPPPPPIVFEGLTLHELIKKALQKLREHDFAEARRLFVALHEVNKQKQ